MYRSKKVCVVIPAYNAEGLIGRVIETIPEYVDLIIVVDDKSADATLDIVKQYETLLRDRLILIRHEANKGKGAALTSGYNKAIEKNMDITASMDADGQMDPRELSRLLDPIVEGKADYSKGDRLSSAMAWRAMPKHRFLGNHALSFLTKIASGYWHVNDSQCGYTAASLAALKAIEVDGLYQGYGVPADMLIRLSACNLTVRNVPVTPIYNIGERSGIRLWRFIPAMFFLLLKGFLRRIKERHRGKVKAGRKILLILLMALLLRIAAITYLGNVYKPLSADGYRYNLIATNLREGRGYTVMGQPDILTGPLYVFFLSAAYFTFGHSYLIIRGLQILMNITSIYLIYRFMRQKSGETPALICALILGLSPYMALKNLTLTTETLSGFINVSFALLLTKAERDGRFFSYCLAGLALGLSVLTRPVSALFPFFYPAAIMIFYRKEIRLKRFAARWLVFLISALTLVAPWATRNYLIFRRPIPATGFSAGLALYAASLNYNRPQPFNTEERKAMISFKTPEEWFSTPADYLLDCERQFFKAALRNIRRHPARFLSSGVFYAIPVLCNLSFPDRDLELRGLIGWFKYRLMRKVASAVKADFKPVLKGAAILTLFILGVCWWLFNLAVFLFGLAGFYIFRKSDSFRAILIILAYALLTHGFFTAARSRYFLPFYPMFLALAVAAAWRLLAKKRRFSKYF